MTQRPRIQGIHPLRSIRNMTLLAAAGITMTLAFGTAAFILAPSVFASVINVLGVGSLEASELIGGPAAVTVRTISFAPGEVGVWHYHPGPLVNVVTQGTVTLEDGYCGPDRSFGPGQAFEEGSRIHRPRNNGEDATFAYQTFIIPQGQPTTINLPNFVPRCHR